MHASLPIAASLLVLLSPLAGCLGPDPPDSAPDPEASEAPSWQRVASTSLSKAEEGQRAFLELNISQVAGDNETSRLWLNTSRSTPPWLAVLNNHSTERTLPVSGAVRLNFRPVIDPLSPSPYNVGSNSSIEIEETGDYSLVFGHEPAFEHVNVSLENANLGNDPRWTIRKGGFHAINDSEGSDEVSEVGQRSGPAVWEEVLPHSEAFAALHVFAHLGRGQMSASVDGPHPWSWSADTPPDRYEAGIAYLERPSGDHETRIDVDRPSPGAYLAQILELGGLGAQVHTIEQRNDTRPIELHDPTLGSVDRSPGSELPGSLGSLRAR